MPGDAHRPIREIECLLAHIDQPQSLAVRFEIIGSLYKH